MSVGEQRTSRTRPSPIPVGKRRLIEAREAELLEHGRVVQAKLKEDFLAREHDRKRRAA